METTIKSASPPPALERLPELPQPKHLSVWSSDELAFFPEHQKHFSPAGDGPENSSLNEEFLERIRQREDLLSQLCLAFRNGILDTSTWDTSFKDAYAQITNTHVHGGSEWEELTIYDQKLADFYGRMSEAALGIPNPDGFRTEPTSEPEWISLRRRLRLCYKDLFDNVFVLAASGSDKPLNDSAVDTLVDGFAKALKPMREGRTEFNVDAMRDWMGGTFLLDHLKSLQGKPDDYGDFLHRLRQDLEADYTRGLEIVGEACDGAWFRVILMDDCFAPYVWEELEI